MNPDLFKARARALLEWAQGESGRAFFINGYIGHSMTFDKGVLTLREADGSEIRQDCCYEITAATVERFEYSPDDYQFQIVMAEDGQGYDIEAYDLQRIDFEDENKNPPRIYLWSAGDRYYWDDYEDHGGFDRCVPKGPFLSYSEAAKDAERVFGVNVLEISEEKPPRYVDDD